MDPVNFKPLDPTRKGPASSTFNPNDGVSSAVPPPIMAYHLGIEKGMMEDEAYRAENISFQLRNGTMYASDCSGAGDPKTAMTPGQVYEYQDKCHKFNATFRNVITDYDDETDTPTMGYNLSIHTNVFPDDKQFVSGGIAYQIRGNSMSTRENNPEASWEEMKDNEDTNLNTTGTGGSHTALAEPMRPGMWRFLKDSEHLVSGFRG